MRATRRILDLIVTMMLLFIVAPVPPTISGERYECLLEPWRVIKLGARNTGVLEVLAIDRGDEVTAGQQIASLNSEVEQATVALAEARAESMIEIDLAEARAAYEQLSLKRNEALYERRVISSQQIDEARAAYRIGELRVAEAEHQRQLAELEYQRALAQFDLKSIRAPISGVVVTVDRSEGEYVDEGDHIATIAQIDPIRAEAFLPLEMLEWLKEGAQVRVFPQQPIGGQFVGIIDVVDRVVEARSGTIGIRVRVNNPAKRTLAGLRCDLEF